MRKYIDANIIYNTKNIKKEKWLEARKEGIGGSDASSILGLNPYKSAVSVYMEKIDDNYALEKTNYKMELGNKLEDFVAREFSLKTGKKVRNINGILRNDKYPFAIANIDRAIVSEKAFLECTVTNSFSKKEWIKEVPTHIKIQCYHYMAVSGATHCYVAALIGNEELVVHKLQRDQEAIEDIMKKEEAFYNECIIGENIPLPDGSEDYSNFLKSKYKESKNETLLLFIKEDKINRYDELVKNIKKLENEKKCIEQYIQDQMKECEVAFIGDRKITWKNQIRSSLDSKKLKKEHPEIADKFMKTTKSRVFRI